MEKGEEEQAEEEISEEQRKRAEANRLAALAKRRTRLTEPNQDSWKHFKCRKISLLPSNVSFHKPQTPSPLNPPPMPCTPSPPPQKFRARLEICSSDSFSVTPAPLEGFTYPGEQQCMEKLRDCLSCVRTFSHNTMLVIAYIYVFIGLVVHVKSYVGLQDFQLIGSVLC